MSKILSFIFCLVSIISLSQQIVEVCPGESEVVTYSVQSNTPGEIVWEVDGTTYNTPQLIMDWQQPGTYVITAKQINGPCEDIQYLTVVVTSCDNLIYYVPNTFTPDDDEFNNVFQPVFTDGFDLTDYDLSIFNRWGELVFESFDSSKGWDGYFNKKRCPDGLYTWMIKFGKRGTDDKQIIFGHVILIR